MIACLCRYHRKSLPQTSHPEFAALDETAQNIVAKLIPLLRLAVALDQSQEQRVDMVTVSLLPQSVTIRVQSTRDFDIEKYYAEQTAQVFRSTYGRDLLVSAAN
jgi:exopolyphosphatase/guanosine-5'-triphosphate,3'-diphosphate pyrophosphatase